MNHTEIDSETTERVEAFMSNQEGAFHGVIHTATAAAAAACAIPFPGAGTIGATAAQIAMITGLANVFGVSLGKEFAKAIFTSLGAAFIGQRVAMAVPGFGIPVAIAATEALGWKVVSDFKSDMYNATYNGIKEHGKGFNSGKVAGKEELEKEILAKCQK